MGFCHQKDLFRIASKSAFYLPVLKLHEKKDFFYILRKKCGELTVDNRCSVTRHGPLSGETIHALGLKTGDYWKVSHESKGLTSEPNKCLGPYGDISES